MSDCYIGEIRMFAGNFVPINWALCDGQLLPIEQNLVLFSLIGTTYGGNGHTTFALPDLRGRLPVTQGSSSLGSYVLGQSGGAEEVVLVSSQLPEHTHPVNSQIHAGNSENIRNNFWASAPNHIYSPTTTGLTNMSPSAVSSTGDNKPHANMMPFLCVNYIIALDGATPIFE